MKKIGRFIFGIIFCCTFNTLFSQTPLSICEITNFPIDGLEIVTVGVVTEIVDDDQFMLTSGGCSILCDGEINELPWIGYKIFIEGVVEYEKIGNDLEIDTDDWLLLYDTDPPDPPPPATVFTVEDALLADIGSIASLSGEVLEYTDTIFGLASFVDSTGTLDMDFSSNDKPDVEQSIQVLGVVEFGDTANEIDVSYWYYEGGSTPPESPPVAWNIEAVDTLPLGSFCFIHGVVTSWTNEEEGTGVFAADSDSMNIDFESVVKVLPDIGDSIYVLGKVGEMDGNRVIIGYHSYDEFDVFEEEIPMSICQITNYPINEMKVFTVGIVTDIVSKDQYILSSEGCSILCDGEINELPWLGFKIFIKGIVEYEKIGNDLEIDTEYWLLIDDENPPDQPPEGPPIAWDVTAADTLPLGAYCFIQGTVTSWTNKNNGQGTFGDDSDSMNIDFEKEVVELPVFGDSVYVLGKIGEMDGNRVIVGYHYYEEFIGQTPISVCDIVENPENRMEVVTIGQVTDIIDNDQFTLSADGCDILCDGDVNELPELGMNIIVEGVVETEDDGDELEIDVEYWAEYGDDPTFPPQGIINTVAEALSAQEGEAAFLTGKITEYTDPNDGIGDFADSTGTMTMDFREGTEPDTNDLIHVLGVIEEEDGTNEIDVSYWYYDSGEPPTGAPDYASSVDEAESLPLGTYCFILGAVTSWMDENDGEGVFDDGDNSMNIDFEKEVETFPSLGDSVYVLGIIGEDMDVREIEAYYWMAEDLTGVDDPSALSFRIHVYPNPVTNILYIDSDERISRAIVYSIKGEIMKEISRPEISTINVSDLKSGLYVVSLYNEKEYLISKRLVKE